MGMIKNAGSGFEKSRTADGFVLNTVALKLKK
jgi:hypothetical protein